MTHLSRTSRLGSGPFILIAIFMLCVFLTGGATRSDVQSLILLRPLSVLVCGIALLTLQRQHLVNSRNVVVAFALIFTLAVAHLVPLPPFIWQSMAGRQELAQVETLAGIGSLWRPLTVTPMNGMQALLSLFAPLAIILLGVQLDRRGLFRLLPLLIMLGAFSGFVGLMQTVSGSSSQLYFYNITNHGVAVGLFANRNHGATLLACLLPMISAYVSTKSNNAFRSQYQKLLIVGATIVLFPLILISGSRSGAALAIVGLIGAILLYKPIDPLHPRTRVKSNQANWLFLMTIVSVALLIAFITYYFSRAEAISRIFRPAAADAGRLEYWAASLEIFYKYFPWGSGSGSFAEAYQTLEPTNLLSTNYLNRAHNDWLETGITFGLPGIALMTAGLVWYVLQSYRVWRRSNLQHPSIQLARLGSINLLILGLASISDYPLRTPILMCCAAIFTLWLTWSDGNDFRLGKKGNSR